AGVVVLVVPAVGQGKSESASLHWFRTRTGATLTSYDLGAFDGGGRVFKGFRLRNSGLTKSDKLTIRLTGSSAFSLALDHCTKKSLGRKWCLVSVAYSPLGLPKRDDATLTATGAHGTAASLSISGSNTGPSGHVYWGDVRGDAATGTVSAVSRGGGSVTTLA